MRGDVSKYLFIDSEIGDGRVSLPPMPFATQGHEKMSFTLLNFTMNKRWPKINRTNNTFYIFDSDTDTYYEVEIPVGTYHTFTSLKNVIQTEISKVITASLSSLITSITVSYETAERAFTFTTVVATTSPVTDVSRFQIRCFHIKDGTVPAGVSAEGAFSDVHEIIGGRPLRNTNNLQNSFEQAGNVMMSRYPASLNSCSSLYLRFNLDTGNYESPGLDIKSKDQAQMQHSDIFAQIPIESGNEELENSHEIVTYHDCNDTFQIWIPQKSVEHLQLYVTDKRNRRLTEFDRGQTEDGLMNFNVILRWDKFIGQKPEESVIERPIPPQLYPPQYGYGMPRI